MGRGLCVLLGALLGYGDDFVCDDDLLWLRQLA